MMNDSVRDVRNTDSFVLARLLSLGSDASETWTDNDLREMALQLLRGDLAVELSAWDSEAFADTVAECARSTPAITCLAEALRHPCPPMSLLEGVKDFAKRSRSAPGPVPGGFTASLLPRELSAVFYHIAIALARLRHGVRISRLDDATCRDALKWVSAQEWVPEELKEVAREGLAGS